MQKELKTNFQLSSFWNIFNLTYSGTKKATNEVVISKLTGSWHLSETGDYIFLKHTKKGRNNYEYEVREIVTISSIFLDSIILNTDNWLLFGSNGIFEFA